MFGSRGSKIFAFVAFLAFAVGVLVFLQIPITNLASSWRVDEESIAQSHSRTMVEHEKTDSDVPKVTIRDTKEASPHDDVPKKKQHQKEEPPREEPQQQQQEAESTQPHEDDSTQPKEDEGHQLTTEELLDQADEKYLKFFANSVVDGGYRPGLYAGWRDFSFRMRTYKRLFWVYDKLLADDQLDLVKFASERQRYYDDEDNDVGTPRDRMLWRLEKQLFPWAHVHYQSLLEMWRSEKGSGMRRGIVVCVHNGLVRLANTMMYNVRRVHKSNIPIAVAHSGDELSDQAKMMFKHRYNATIIDVDKYVDANMLGGLRGFQIKHFALLLAPFAETMLVDADATFLQPPEVFFEEPGYKTDGTIFFTDRTGMTGQYPPKKIWVDNNVPHPISERVKRLRWYNERSSYEVESGIVLVDKSKRFPGVLAGCLLMAKEERQEIFRTGYGDKEAFWQAFEMAGEPFYIRPDPPGCIGAKRDAQSACYCHILHFDLNKQPLWFNGGIQQNKNELNGGVIAHSHYGFEGRWDWTPLDCVIGGEINHMPPEAIRIVDESWVGYSPDPVHDFLKKELETVQRIDNLV